MLLCVFLVADLESLRQTDSGRKTILNLNLNILLSLTSLFEYELKLVSEFDISENLMNYEIVVFN